MLLWMTLALAGGPDWSALSSTGGWTQKANRSSAYGEVIVSHKRIGELDCLQGVVQAAATPEQLLAVVLDVPSSMRWSSADLLASELLAPNGANIRFWQHVSIPNWTLASDRYWVIEGSVTTPSDGLGFRWTRVAASDYPDVVARSQAFEQGSIEPPANWGEWVFRRVGGGTEVHYRACANVGGSLPEAVQTWIATRTLPDTVADLIREALRRG